MAGELWRSSAQAAVEVTAGTVITTSTRRLYLMDPVFERKQDPRYWKFATGSRDNVRAFTQGPQEVSGKLKIPMSADELIEFLLIGVKGGVTPTTPVGGTLSRLWTFVPGSTALDSASLKWDDGAQVWIMAGAHVDQIKIKGAANKENEVEVDLFARSLAAGSLTAGLAERVPRFSEGWQTKVYIDAFAATPGTTVKAATLINWDVTFKNNLARKYFADNTNATGSIPVGEMDVEAKLTIEAAAASGAAEFANFIAATKRLVRLEFGQTDLIEGALYYYVKIDLPMAWSAFDLGQKDENTRVYELTGQYVYDPTNTFGCQFLVQNARTAAWGV
jgi:hypothetical protein